MHLIEYIICYKHIEETYSYTNYIKLHVTVFLCILGCLLTKVPSFTRGRIWHLHLVPICMINLRVIFMSYQLLCFHNTYILRIFLLCVKGFFRVLLISQDGSMWFATDFTQLFFTSGLRMSTITLFFSSQCWIFHVWELCVDDTTNLLLYYYKPLYKISYFIQPIQNQKTSC